MENVVLGVTEVCVSAKSVLQFFDLDTGHHNGQHLLENHFTLLKIAQVVPEPLLSSISCRILILFPILQKASKGNDRAENRTLEISLHLLFFEASFLQIFLGKLLLHVLGLDEEHWTTISCVLLEMDERLHVAHTE
jgi:hypothetical protein